MNHILKGLVEKTLEHVDGRLGRHSRDCAVEAAVEEPQQWSQAGWAAPLQLGEQVFRRGVASAIGLNCLVSAAVPLWYMQYGFFESICFFL